MFIFFTPYFLLVTAGLLNLETISSYALIYVLLVLFISYGIITPFLDTFNNILYILSLVYLAAKAHLYSLMLLTLTKENTLLSHIIVSFIIIGLPYFTFLRHPPVLNWKQSR